MRSVLGYSALLALTACGSIKAKNNNERKDDAKPLAFDAGFDLSELAPTGGEMKKLSSNEVKTYFAHNDDFLVDNTDSSDSNEDDSDADSVKDEGSCVTEAYLAGTVRAAGGVLTSVSQHDLAACYQERAKDHELVTTTVSKYLLTVSFYVSCPGADYSTLEGKSIKEALKGLDCEKDENSAMSFNTKFDMAMESKYKLNSEITYRSEQTIWNGQVASDGSACKLNPALTDCVKTVKTIYKSENSATGKAESELSYVRQVFKGEHAEGENYMKGAPVEVTKNDWTGTVTLFDGIRTPEFSMSNGAETITGAVATDVAK